jgi:tripartite-type tricarboxylate transporter receptor subunit TctC
MSASSRPTLTPSAVDTRRRRLLGAVAASPLALAAPSWAAAPDNKPLRLIVPFPAGGGVDVFARPLAPALSEALGVPVVIENIGGAASRIGSLRVAQSAPDGTTLLLTNDTLVASDAVARAAGQEAVLPRLKPVTLAITSCNLFVTHPKSGFSDPAGYLRALKTGKVNIGVPGWGTAHHLTSATLNHRLGVSAQHIPYRGGAPLLNDVLSGTLQAGVVTMAAALGHIQAGTLVGIAVTSPKRAPALPAVPTLTESIAPGYTHQTWQGLLAPAGTPDAIVARLHAGVVQALRHPSVIERLPTLGFDAEGQSGPAFGAMLDESYRNFEAVVRATGIQAEQG